MGLLKKCMVISVATFLIWTLFFAFAESMDTLEDKKITLEVPAEKGIPGTLFFLYLNGLEPHHEVILDQKLSGKPTIHRVDEGKVEILIPTSYRTKIGKYPIKVSVSDGDIIKEVGSIQMTITSRSYDKQYLKVSKQTVASTKTKKANDEYDKVFAPVRDKSRDEKLWDGPFIKPVDGRISTGYGMMRYVNGAETSYRHSGLDIAAKKGTPVKASNSGEVVFSKKLILTGETLVIDHGLGLFSVYYHLDKRKIETGKMVEKGQVIATVGSTGFSTGPHLHFIISHHRTNLDPDLMYLATE